MQAGEVWWVHFDDRRPVVLVAADGSGIRGIQVVAPSGVDLAGLGVEIDVGATDGLPLDGVVRIGFPRPGYHPCTWLTSWMSITSRRSTMNAAMPRGIGCCGTSRTRWSLCCAHRTWSSGTEATNSFAPSKVSMSRPRGCGWPK